LNFFVGVYVVFSFVMVLNF